MNLIFGFDANKTKVHLKMAVERLKLLQGKKTNLNKGKRREIAKLLEQGKEESARVLVEHIIREDFIVEAYEILEVQVQLLLARMGVIEEDRICPNDILEAVCSLIWVESRCSEISELAEIKKQFTKKYGKEFIEDSEQFVNPKIRHKLSLRAPDETLVASYLNEIAKVFGVDWQTEIEPVPASFFGVPETFSDQNNFRGNDGNNGSNGGGGDGGNVPVSNPFAPTKPSQNKPAQTKQQTPQNNPFLTTQTKSSTPTINSESEDDSSSLASSLPPVPNGKGDPSSSAGGVPSFEDLAARFESLKNK